MKLPRNAARQSRGHHLFRQRSKLYEHIARQNRFECGFKAA
jgi:hypothetical protein